jgi:hypothetical protein
MSRKGATRRRHFILSRASSRAADVGRHEPPRGVRMPRSFSSAAMARTLVTPWECRSSTIARRLAPTGPVQTYYFTNRKGPARRGPLRGLWRCHPRRDTELIARARSAVTTDDYGVFFKTTPTGTNSLARGRRMRSAVNSGRHTSIAPFPK